MLTPYSSRRAPLDSGFLRKHLNGATGYDRIAGYFSSSLIEVAGEGLLQLEGKIRVVCNSELQAVDVATAKAAQQAMTQEWRQRVDVDFVPAVRERLGVLYDLLQSGKLEVRVLPDTAFGLIHGKAGVITYGDGRRTSFLGSVNESRTAWQRNYELLWQDDAPATVDWVQEEFDTLWNHPLAQPLAEMVVKDIRRLSRRVEVTHAQWELAPKPEQAIVESPIYQQHHGLWAYQKYFVKRAFEEHLSGRGARFVLADQVGLGKTVQMALAAMLMSLHDGGRVLVLAPKTLIYQWQEELMKLLGLPSAVWDGRQWLDEQGVRHVNGDATAAITRCPRRFGIVSQGLVTAGNAAVAKLLDQDYTCVIVDEAHRSRRANLGKNRENEAAEPNKLMAFLAHISRRTKNMIMGTATPVQLYPIEAYDLLQVLAQGSEHVLGNEFSSWRRDDKPMMFAYVQGEKRIHNVDTKWAWMRNPWPPYTEHANVLFDLVRRDLKMADTDAVIPGDRLRQLSRRTQDKFQRETDLIEAHNPFVEHIVRRTRTYLEETFDPKTGETYLPKVAVELYPRGDEGAIALPAYLADAYEAAEAFCKALGSVMKGAGFTRMLLLRRMGSSLVAGLNTARVFAGVSSEAGDTDDDADEDDDAQNTPTGIAARIGAKELQILKRLIDDLETHSQADPKLARLEQILFGDRWLERGCIVFSQYYDTVYYFSQQLSLKHPTLAIGVYAGADKSGRWLAGHFLRTGKEDLKAAVKAGTLTLLFGTDSASEGLNLQTLGTLINLDLPWNPTRLEQRKGRIQRIGQRQKTVLVYNMRYKDSVEDRVHDLLSQRLEEITNLFGQVPDILEDVWIKEALGEREAAKALIRSLPARSPFELKYDKIYDVDFETCATVLNREDIVGKMRRGW